MPTPPRPDFEHAFDMAITRAEFERLLALATGTAFVCEGAGYRAAEGAPGWRVEIEALPARRIGSIELARHQVSIDLGALDAAARGAWLQRFWRVYHRGGG